MKKELIVSIFQYVQKHEFKQDIRSLKVDQYMKTVTNLINSQTEDVSKEVVALWGRWWVLSDLRTFFICMSFILKDLFYSRVTVFSATKLCYQNTFTAIHWKLIQSCPKIFSSEWFLKIRYLQMVIPFKSYKCLTQLKV